MKKFFLKKNSSIAEAMNQLSDTGEKNLVITSSKQKLLGTISDGDLRRAILKKKKLTESIFGIYNSTPFFLFENEYSLNKVKKIALRKNIYVIPVVDKTKKVINILFFKDLFSKNSILKKKDLNIPVVIMAGGRGRRLEPFTKILPKPLIPIDGIPVIEHIMNSFENIGSREFHISLNYKSKMLKLYFEEFDKRYKISFLEEMSPLGTAGSLSLLKRKISKNFFVTNSDVILDTDNSQIYDFHIKNNNDITIVAVAKEYEISYGICKLNKDGSLKKIEEKPSFDLLINSGIYLFNNNILRLLKKNKKIDMNQLIDIALKKKFKIKIYPVLEREWRDIGQWTEYKKTIDIFN